MHSPLLLKNVSYKVAGSSTYVGELIITDKLIYYFPQRQLGTWIYKVGYLFHLLMGSIVALLVGLDEALKEIGKHLLKEHVIKPFTHEGRMERKDKEWLDKLDNSYRHAEIDPKYLFQIILYPTLWYPLLLDSIIVEMNTSHSILVFALPKPIRFSSSMVKGITLSGRGSLIIETEYEMKHKFRIGFMKKRLLREALNDWGYLLLPDAPNNSLKPTAS